MKVMVHSECYGCFHKHRKHLNKFSFFIIIYKDVSSLSPFTSCSNGGQRRWDENSLWIYFMIIQRIKQATKSFLPIIKCVFGVTSFDCVLVNISGQLNQIRFVSCQITICSMTHRHEFSKRNTHTHTPIQTRMYIFDKTENRYTVAQRTMWEQQRTDKWNIQLY